MNTARLLRVAGVVQGVGFRPFVYRIAQASALSGWVANTNEGVEILIEGADRNLERFVQELKTQHPPGACITALEIHPAESTGLEQFTILETQRKNKPTTRISPDLPVCDACLRELFDPQNRRYHYPYINCTDCGPRYSIIRSLPYDRPNTTMRQWQLDDYCSRDYHDVLNRRFHAQPIACPACGPTYYLYFRGECIKNGDASILHAARLLNCGVIVAIKGLGGYHLVCDARNPTVVRTLRRRKYRKEKPFALMVKDLQTARELIEIQPETEALLTSVARPIVLARATAQLPDVAPENQELGVMLPYTPLHHLLFAVGAPKALVMTSANRSSEPIAYKDEEALRILSEIADAFVIGERAIARRVDDSVVRAGAFGPVVLRRSRGFAPSAVATLPTQLPILAVGADLKNSVALIVDGQAFVSEHIGDLDHYECRVAFDHTIHGLLSMYGLDLRDVLVVHDAHPDYISSSYVRELTPNSRAVQHHRAHIASVLAERGCPETPAIGISFDGTGYGDDGTFWGGEIFAGSIASGFNRVARLRPALLPGGDGAARYPVQAAAGFLSQLDRVPDLTKGPFYFPGLYRNSVQMIRSRVRTFTTTSVGRLFDTAAALLGFTRMNTFEGQGAIWLENNARASRNVESYSFPFIDNELDFRPLLEALIADRAHGRNPQDIARAFQLGIAQGTCDAIHCLCRTQSINTVVLSGGVFQNDLLLNDIKYLLAGQPIQIWTNHAVPPNDGGISLGQAALAAFNQFSDHSYA
jgi:hydrogenase maturation protein HypF